MDRLTGYPLLTHPTCRIGGGRSSRASVEVGGGILGSLGSLAVNTAPEDWPVPGLELESVTTQLRGMYEIPEEVKGVVITSIHDDFDYGTQIVEGTVICEINGSLSNSVAKARKLVHSGVNRLYIWRKGAGYRFIAIRKE